MGAVKSVLTDVRVETNYSMIQWLGGSPCRRGLRQHRGLAEDEGQAVVLTLSILVSEHKRLKLYLPHDSIYLINIVTALTT